MGKACVLCYPISEQERFRSDWANDQPDLSLRKVQSNCCFAMQINTQIYPQAIYKVNLKTALLEYAINQIKCHTSVYTSIRLDSCTCMPVLV